MKKTMEFTIVRSKWLRGEGTSRSRLVRAEDCKMCCLGFLGVACGISAKDLSEIKEPDGVKYELVEKWPELIIDEDTNTDWCNELMSVNDDPKMEDQDREQAITEIFSKGDIKVTFVDEDKDLNDSSEALPNEILGNKRPIVKRAIIWNFYDAPTEYRALSEHGGDEEGVALIPHDMDIPYWMERMWDTFGDYQTISLPEGRLIIWAH